MPRLTFAQHTIQTSAAIHAEAELNQTVSNPLSSHQVFSKGESPNQKYSVYFYYPDESASCFDGREWKYFPAVNS